MTLLVTASFACTEEGNSNDSGSSSSIGNDAAVGGSSSIGTGSAGTPFVNPVATGGSLSTSTDTGTSPVNVTLGGTSAVGTYTSNTSTGGTSTVVTTAVSAGGTSAGGTVSQGASARWVMGYYVGYQSSVQPPSEIDWTGMSHLAMGVVLANANGTLDLTFYQGSTAAGKALAKDVSARAHAAGKKPILMLGGAGNGSAILSAMQNQRSTFVANLVTSMTELGYDGIDLDWEDSVDLTLFIELAKALRTAAPSAILTVPGYPINSNYETVDANIPGLIKYLDQYNLMSYYPATAYAGSGWQSWHNAPLDGAKSTTPVTISDSLKRYADAGVPKEKLGMGVAFYAICYTGGITAPNQNTDNASIRGGDNDYPLSKLFESGVITNSTRKWDAVAQVPYLSLNTPDSNGCRYVSYDDEESLIAKGEFAKKNGYGGVIVWTISQGYMSNRASGLRNPLMTALKHGFLD
jgi:chitinase